MVKFQWHQTLDTTQPKNKACQWRSGALLWIVASILPCRRSCIETMYCHRYPFSHPPLCIILYLYYIIIFWVIVQEWCVLFLLLTIEWKLKLTLSTSQNAAAQILTPEVLYYFTWNMSRPKKRRRWSNRENIQVKGWASDWDETWM